MSHPVVVAVSEGDEARAAVALGVGAARLLHAPLVLAGVAVCQAPAGATVVPGWAAAFDPEELRELVTRRVTPFTALVPADVECTVAVVASTAIVPGLRIAVEEHQAQMLVVGPTHLGTVARAFRGDVASGTTRHASCPVLVAPAGGEVPDSWPQRIGVAWDGSVDADAALGLATGLASRSGAALRILRVYDPAESMAVALSTDPVLLQQAVDAARERVETEVRDAVEIAARTTRCDSALLEGPAASALVDAAAGLDLLVIGARHQGPVRRLLLGSVSAAVVHHADCPVLVVPHGAAVPVAA